MIALTIVALVACGFAVAWGIRQWSRTTEATNRIVDDIRRNQYVGTFKIPNED